MGLVELFVAVLIAGVSVLNTAIPLAAWNRMRDVRFLFLAAGNALFAVLGAIWVWGQLPVSPPDFATASLPILLIALGITVLILLSSLWSRRP